MKIADIKIGQRFRKDIGDIKQLAESIKEVGLLHPIVISENNELIAGYRRLKACESLGWTEVPINVVRLEDLSEGEFHENINRKNFTISEIVAIKRARQEKERAKARNRQGTRTDLGKQLPEESAESREIISKFAGISHDTLSKAETIVEAAEKEPKKFQPLLDRVEDGKTSINYAYKMVKRAIETRDFPKLPEGEFNVIYADPPWRYELAFIGSPDSHYVTLPTEKIASLQIPVSQNAILFLWSTNPMLEDALTVMKTWGFEYKTNMVWVKDRPATGYYVFGQHELLLIGLKGIWHPPLEQNRFSSVMNVPKTNHSKKPEVVYEIIEKMYPNQKYLELFARQKREKWTSWGLEIEGKNQANIL